MFYLFGKAEEGRGKLPPLKKSFAKITKRVVLSVKGVFPLKSGVSHQKGAAQQKLDALGAHADGTHHIHRLKLPSNSKSQIEH